MYGPSRVCPSPLARHPGPREWSESPGTAGGHRGPSGTGLRRPGRLVDTAGPLTRPRGSQDSWSNTLALQNGFTSPGKAGRLLSSLDSGPSSPEQMVEPTGPWTRARFSRECWSTPRALDPGPKSLEKSCSTPRALGPKREWPGTAGRPAGIGTEQESPGKARRPRGPSDPSASVQGQLVDTTGPWVRARFPRDSQSTSQALGPGPKKPGTACRPRRHLDLGRSRPGHLLHPVGLQAWA